MRPVGPRSSGGRFESGRPSAPSQPGVETGPLLHSPVRLRHVLLGALLAAAGAWIWPRAASAFALHSLAVKKAEHALCMAGPMGPGLLRADPEGLTELLRRRVTRSGPEDQPFGACAQLAEEIGLPHAAYKAHLARAASFVEYRDGPGAVAGVSVDSLAFGTRDVEDLARDAWPFVREGALGLIEPSRHAKEAAHPSPVPSPGLGRGLPGTRFHYRSTLARGSQVMGAFGSGANAKTLVSNDGGVSWVPGGGQAASEIMDRCLADEEGHAYSLSLTETGRQVVLSQGPEAPPQASVLSEAGESVASVSCDARALVAALVQSKDGLGRRPVRFRVCPFREPCRDLTGPDAQRPVYYPADILRMEGDTIVSRTYAGLTRVTSTRDDGQTWSPWVVAFDAESAHLLGNSAPFRLLAAGERTLLFGRAVAPGGSYALLVSEDHGASFHAP